jgi:hypothetical protein
MLTAVMPSDIPRFSREVKYLLHLVPCSVTDSNCQLGHFMSVRPSPHGATLFPHRLCVRFYSGLLLESDDKVFFCGSNRYKTTHTSHGYQPSYVITSRCVRGYTREGRAREAKETVTFETLWLQFDVIWVLGKWGKIAINVTVIVIIFSISFCGY